MIDKLEAILFLSGGRVSKKDLVNYFDTSIEEVEDTINELVEKKREDGVVCVYDGNYVSLATNSNIEDFVEKFLKKELEAPLSKASQITLSIISYASPISKTDLDIIRGVNSQFSIKKLMIKGLIQQDEKKAYSITTDFLEHMGISKIDELENYEERRTKILSSLELIKEKLKQKDD